MKQVVAAIAVLALVLVACSSHVPPQEPANTANAAGEAAADPVLDSFDQALDDTSLDTDGLGQLDQLDQDLQIE